ncbi:hypothetical protein QYE76_030108 [Lolium multiflorum]|uniref:Uncharacterized protein n=1 Tax=Lolium multiflorum TaxID=4521 RepID=A0AAD8QP36_LOLMU|nr:hypothetical protein QYE76_030108 [Lolium multiflorum]
MPATSHAIMLPLSSLHSNPNHHALLLPYDLLNKPVCAIGRMVGDKHQTSTRPRRSGATGTAWPRPRVSAGARTVHASPRHLAPPLAPFSPPRASPCHRERTRHAHDTDPRPLSPETPTKPRLGRARPRMPPTKLGTAQPRRRRQKDRLDTLNRTPPSPSLLAHRNARAHVDLLQHPRHPSAIINRGFPSSISSQNHPPLIALDLLRHSSVDISRRRPSIASAEPASTRRRHRRLELPQAAPPVPGGPPSSTPSSSTLPALAAPPMEPTNVKFYQLGNGGDLIFERDLDALSEYLGRPHPEFHGVEVNDQPGGELQWVITADLRGKVEPPTSERILFSFRESSWLDGLACALQEALARLCGQNVVAILASRFANLARRDSIGVPMELQLHPELRHHVDHLDFMLYQTQKELDNSRAYANQTHMALAHHADAIKMLAKDRKSLRLQRAKKDATIARLRAKIVSLEATVKAQEDQLMEMEEEGEDIQGGGAFLSDDDDFEEDEYTDVEDYEFLEAGVDYGL